VETVSLRVLSELLTLTEMAIHRLFQPSRKGTRGSYTGKRAAKLSAQRISSQFGQHELTVIQHQSKRGISRTVQSLTSANIDSNDAWVHYTLPTSERSA